MHKTMFSLTVLGWITVSSASNLAQDAAENPTLTSLQAKLRESNPPLADEFNNRLQQSLGEVKQFGRGHVIFGRVEVEGDQDPRAVVAQMIVLQDGYFVDAIGAAEKPIGFRLTGYESAVIVPKGPGPIEDVGTIPLKRLPPEELCSATGRLIIESHPAAPKLKDLTVVWNIRADPINTPSNGTEGITNFQRQMTSKADDDGSFAINDLSPGRYNLHVDAPNCVQFFKPMKMVTGANRLDDFRLELARKMNVEYAVSAKEEFNDVEFKKTSLKANDRWRANGDTPEHAFDLLINQKEGKLVLDYRYGPCHIQDLGAAGLDDDLDVDMEKLKSKQPQSVPVEEGHIYLIYQASWNHWILMRTTEVGSIAAEKKD